MTLKLINTSSRKRKIQSEKLLWPKNIGKKIYKGFSDKEIKFLCSWDINKYDAELFNQNIPRLYMRTELYSFGRCLRDWLNLPNWFPLPIYGDHGITRKKDLARHEIEAKPIVHFTSDGYRAKELAKKNKKKIILHIPHPWITFRKLYNIKKKKDAKGTLIFLPHSNPQIKIINYDFDKYFSEIKKLPKKYHPLIICLQRNDATEENILKFRKYNLPIISAGEVTSAHYVERFYSMISRFNFATSNRGGSELFYCEELGVKFFLKGKIPEYYNFSHEQWPKGFVNLKNNYEKNYQLKKSIFYQFPPKANIEKKKFVNKILGLDINVELSRKKLIFHLKKELFRHIHLIPMFLIKVFYVRLKYYLIKNLRRNIY